MNRARWSSLVLVVCVSVVLFASGCGRVDLYGNLSEEDANEILVLLFENGIKADKKKVVVQNEVTYAVSVREADMARARALLLQNNLPRRKVPGLGETYGKPSMIPTPDEQQARFMLAMKGEIINSLKRIPQVVDADVVLNVPKRDEFATPEQERLQRPTASAVVRVKPDAEGLETLTEPKIQQFVANAVEGLNPRDVTVIISYLPTEERILRPGDVKTLPTEAPGLPPAAGVKGQPQAALDQELAGLRLDAESKDRLKIYLLVFFLLLIVLSSTLIIAIVQGSRMRRTLAALQGPAGEHPAIEGHVLEEGPPQIPGGEV